MTILDNRAWIEYLNPVMETCKNSNFEIRQFDLILLDKIASDSKEFLNNAYPSMSHSNLKIAATLAYFINERRPFVAKKPSLSKLSDTDFLARLNAIIATRLLLFIIEITYFSTTKVRLNCSDSTHREWRRLFVLKDKCKLNHYGLIIALSLYLDGVFPGRQKPW
ncbi:MAG: hypothetical protein QM523_03815 [Candidatus Pacebacteria bacterium]|nr:hypothetical protein [Candidatus Paceibacterota bacterium]